jgi:thiopeptide-type bacteriocin biosynthesis protein
VLSRRSALNAPIVDELLELERGGRLNQTLGELAPSYIHMHVNRIIRSAQRAHEMVLYDFLYLLYESRSARERKSGTKPPKS